MYLIIRGSTNVESNIGYNLTTSEHSLTAQLRFGILLRSAKLNLNKIGTYMCVNTMKLMINTLNCLLYTQAKHMRCLDNTSTLQNHNT